MYAVMKAALLAPPPSPVATFTDSHGTSYDWQALYDQWIVKNQVKAGKPEAGSWPAGSALPWSTSANSNAVLATEYALLILEKVAPVYDPLASFEDLLRRQAERLASFESLLKVAWGDLAGGQQLAVPAELRGPTSKPGRAAPELRGPAERVIQPPQPAATGQLPSELRGPAEEAGGGHGKL